METNIKMHAISSKPMRLVVDLLDLADRITMGFEGYLKPAPSGLYAHNKLEPVWRDGTNGYILDDTSTLVMVTDINKVTGPIYNARGQCIITALQMANREKMLSAAPYLPYRGMRIARLMYEHCVDSRIRWRKTSSKAYNRIAEEFSELTPDTAQRLLGEYRTAADVRDLNEVRADEAEWLLHKYQSEVDQELGPLIDDHEWHYFLFKDRPRTSLQIDRGQDFRVEWFMREFDAGNIKL
jgi:hypothetical protein